MTFFGLLLLIYTCSTHAAVGQSLDSSLDISCEYFNRDQMFRFFVFHQDQMMLQLQLYANHHIPEQNNTLHRELYKEFLEQLRSFAQKNDFCVDPLAILHHGYQKQSKNFVHPADSRHMIGIMMVHAFHLAITHFPYTSFLPSLVKTSLRKLLTPKEHWEKADETLRNLLISSISTNIPHYPHEKWEFTCSYQAQTRGRCSALLLTMHSPIRFTLTCHVPEKNESCPNPRMHQTIYVSLLALLNTTAQTKFHQRFEEMFSSQKAIDAFDSNERQFMHFACQNTLLYFPCTSFMESTVSSSHALDPQKALYGILRHTKLYYRGITATSNEQSNIASLSLVMHKAAVFHVNIPY